MTSVLGRKVEVDFDDLLVVDFETYYDEHYSLSKTTTEAYVRSSLFEALGVGIDDGDEKRWLEHDEFKRWAKEVDWSKVAVGCHNSAFDCLILSHHYDVYPAFIFCTLSMGRALFGTQVGGSLKKLASYFGVGEKGDEVDRVKGKHRKDFTREEWLKYGDYCLNDVALAKAIFHKMLDDGFPEGELLNIDTTVKMFTEPKFVLNKPLLEEFLVEERQRKKGLLERIEKDKSIVLSNDKFAKLLIDLGEEPPLKTSPRTGLEAWAFAKTDPGMQELLEHERDEVRWAAEARVAVKSTINETRTERLLSMGSRGKLCVPLKYAGAHTFRWSGTDKVNFQNFARGGKIRDALCAPSGYELVAVDSGQIEARITAWLAGHDELVEMFRDPGRDIYAEKGSAFFGYTITKDTHPEERFLSKSMVLGCGFQMGWLKFAGELLKGMFGAPPKKFTNEDADKLRVDPRQFAADSRKMAKVERMPSRLPLEERIIHCAVAEKLIWIYRDGNKPIVNLWETMEQILEVMVSLGENEFDEWLAGVKVVRHGLILPNGLMMRYPGLRKGEDGYSYMGGPVGKERKKAYGGSMTENIVQALARVVVADQMQVLNRSYGYPVVSMTHDEVVLMVPEAEAERAAERCLTVFRTPPEWAKGLPLNATVGHGKNYGEAK